MNDGMFDQLGDMMGQQLEEMNQTRDRFTSDIEKQNAESQEVFGKFANRVFGDRRHKPEPLPTEIQQLVDLMKSVPAVVPVLRARADEYMADVNAAFANINAKYTNKPPAE